MTAIGHVRHGSPCAGARGPAARAGAQPNDLVAIDRAARYPTRRSRSRDRRARGQRPRHSPRQEWARAQTYSPLRRRLGATRRFHSQLQIASCSRANASAHLRAQPSGKDDDGTVNSTEDGGLDDGPAGAAFVRARGVVGDDGDRPRATWLSLRRRAWAGGTGRRPTQRLGRDRSRGAIPNASIAISGPSRAGPATATLAKARMGQSTDVLSPPTPPRSHAALSFATTNCKLFAR